MNITTKKVKDILISIKSDINVSDSVDFFENGDFDSFDMINLVSELDREFKIKILGIDILPENFMNIQRIVQLIEKYQK